MNEPSSELSPNLEIVLHYVAEVERRQIAGDIVECGVYQGASICAIAGVLKQLNSSRRIVGFDSFEGLPEPATADHVEDDALRRKASRGYFGDTSLEAVRRRVELAAHGGDIQLVPGWFHESLPAFDRPIALLFLDCDFYESYTIALRQLWPLVVPGGFVIFDEYESRKYPGARLAVDEFFAGLAEKPQTDARFNRPGAFTRWFVEKRHGDRSA